MPSAPSNCKIFRATPRDVQSVCEIASVSFRDKWLGIEKEEDVESYISESFSESMIATELNDPDVCFLLAEIEGNIIGYLKLHLGVNPDKYLLNHPAEISKLYLRTSAQSNGFGRLLLNAAFDIAARKNCCDIWLGVWTENHGALRFYERAGFTTFGSHLFVMGNSASEDLLMKKTITKT